MNKLLAIGAVALLGTASTAFAAPSQEEMWKIIQQQQTEITSLKKEQKKTDEAVAETDKKVEATADAIEATGGSLPKALQWATNTTIGGYGEHHYSNYKDSGAPGAVEKNSSVDAHRYVLFVGHKFSDTVRFFSEFELEHGLAGDGKPGEVELEQAYIEWDYSNNHSLVVGQFLVPVGILNETHEPNTFYGVERNLVEKNIVPTTWWESGVMFKGQIAPGLKYDFAIHSGLHNDDFNIRKGRQKSAKAVANDLAYTGRIKYTGVTGLELAATLQYQEDLTQRGNNEVGETSSATLFEAHATYNVGDFSVRALMAEWDIDSDVAETDGLDEQSGWYIEPSYKVMDSLGLFIRFSRWDNTAGATGSEAKRATDYGLNYWLTSQVVFKVDYQNSHEDTSVDSFNLGVGWSF